MKCPACESENPDGYRFCSECGQPMPVECPSCGFANARGGKFCGGCGNPLGEKTAEQKPAQRPEKEAERRQLTVMFCDLVGSTALSQALDPEELRDVIADYQGCCATVIERFGGYIARYMGDGLLVYFGYPEAHENDAERAVRSALEIIAAVQALDGPGGIPLQVRLGVATGRVVVGDIIGSGASEEHAVLGDAPNLAARLQGIAEADTVVISEETRNLVEGAFSFDSLGTRDLKGIAEPVPTYLVRGEVARARSLETMDGIFVDRSAERARLAELWKETEAGRGGFVVISGEPGIGKSRLAWFLASTLSEGAYGFGYFEGSPFFLDTSFRPLSGFIDGLLGLKPGAEPGSREIAIERELATRGIGASDWPNVLHGLGRTSEGSNITVGSLTPQEWKEKTLSVLIDLIGGLAERLPLLILADDAQWFDASTFEFMTRLQQRISNMRVLVVVTHRADYELSIAEKGCHERMALNALPGHDCVGIIDSIVSTERLPRETVEALLDNSGGVPLFVEELAKAVSESGLAKDAAAHHVPTSLQDSLMGRLDRLGEAKEVAQIAAAIGRVFDRELLAATIEAPSAGLDRALEALVGAGLVYVENATYRFKHGLIQETAYRSLLKRRRRQLHERIADVMEEEFPDIGRTEPETVAWHLTEAGKGNRAIPYWIMAGKAAAQVWAHTEAIGHFGKALDLVDARDTSPLDPAGETALLLAAVASMRIVDRLEKALRLLDRAEATARDGGLDQERIRIHYLRGNLYFPLGNIDGCLAEHGKAAELAQKAGSAEDEARALSGLGDGNFLGGRLRSAESYYDRCVGLCRDKGYAEFEITNLPLRGHMRFYLNAFGESVADCSQAAERAAEAGMKRVEMVANGSCLAKPLMELGRWREAGESLEAGLAIARDLGAQRYIPMYLCFLAKVRFATGDRKAALEMAREAVSESRSDGMVYTGPMVLGSLAAVADEIAARDSLDEGIRLLEKRGPFHNPIWFLHDAMSAMLRFGDWDAVDGFAARLTEECSAEPVPWADFHVARCRALAEVGRGSRGVGLAAGLQALKDEADARGQEPAAANLAEALESTK